MHGRSYLCLLAAVGLAIAPVILRAQSDDSRAPRFPVSGPATETLPTSPSAPIPWPPRGPIAPGPASEVDLSQMEKAAGMIFAGSVTQIVRHPGSNAQALETVTITFRIEHSIRGGVPGNELAITQWIGTWLAGQRYRIGERALLFLYPPSTLGLTSCVGGAAGRFRIDPLGRISFSAQQLSMLRKDPVLGGRSRVSFSDFALAVQRAGSQRESEED